MTAEMIQLIHRVEQDDAALHRWIEENHEEEWFREMVARFVKQQVDQVSNQEIMVAMRVAAVYLVKFIMEKDDDPSEG